MTRQQGGKEQKRSQREREKAHVEVIILLLQEEGISEVQEEGISEGFLAKG